MYMQLMLVVHLKRSANKWLGVLVALDYLEGNQKKRGKAAFFVVTVPYHGSHDAANFPSIELSSFTLSSISMLLEPAITTSIPTEIQEAVAAT